MADKQREIILAPGQFGYIQDGTKGIVKVLTGPLVFTPTGQDISVRFGAENGLFEQVTLEQVTQKFVIAVENDYVILKNPTIDEKLAHPPIGAQTNTIPDLQVGHKIILRGPQHFALWPGQSAERVRGHKLRSNQYLLCRVYDAEAAKKNWVEAVATKTKKVIEKVANSADIGGYADVEKVVPVTPPENLTVGTEFVIKGTEVSFYIPPTGVTVLKDSKDGYVRDALSLERMEYCVLIDESGRKRYERGPVVVFPEPTEKFMELEGKKKLPAIELNELQGIHIKANADYKDVKTGKEVKVGEELFITGKETQIYYPREEHNIVSYDGKAKHFATAIPAGEGRYVMNRLTGDIRLEHGPKMLLPDPRTEVVVKRVIDLKDVQLWYPGNDEAFQYNIMLAELAKAAPTTRSGTVSQGELERSMTKGGGVMRSAASNVYGNSSAAGMDRSLLSSNVSAGQIADKFERGSSYTTPRTLTLNTKYEGVPTIQPWIGYAVMVKSKTGKRRVVVGPDTVLLGYDESLETLALSTGKPKNSDSLFKTVYLQVSNNKVSDIIEVETNDHVKVRLHVAYRADFEGDSAKWFSVANYIKLLCDHTRSVLKGTIRKQSIGDFYTNATDVVRDTILGKSAEGKREGMFFPENGLRVKDVEVLNVELLDSNVRSLLDNAQREAFTSSIQIASERRNLAKTIEVEEIARQKLDEAAKTREHALNLQIEAAKKTSEAEIAKAGEAKKTLEAQRKVTEQEQDNENYVFHQEAARTESENKKMNEHQKEINNLQKDMIEAQTLSVTKRFEAARDTLGPVLLTISSQDTMVKIAEATSIQRMIGGENAVDVFHKLFDGTPLEGLAKTLAEKAGGQKQISDGTVVIGGKTKETGGATRA